MSIKGQTHQKRAREFALREKRERKKAKKEALRNPIEPTDAELNEDGEPILNEDGEPILQAEPEPATEWVQ